MGSKDTFATDVAAIRKRAREKLEMGAVTQNYGGDPQTAIALLNEALATEIVCVLRYKFHAVAASGIASESVKEEFAQHAREEEEHMDLIAERINQLGGKPELQPRRGHLPRRVPVRGGREPGGHDPREPRRRADRHRALPRPHPLLRDKDPTTRTLLERVLAQEEEHANDMHDLLVAHEGRPMLKK